MSPGGRKEGEPVSGCCKVMIKGSTRHCPSAQATSHEEVEVEGATRCCRDCKQVQDRSLWTVVSAAAVPRDEARW
jgi:hypothetical protein